MSNKSKKNNYLLDKKDLSQIEDLITSYHDDSSIELEISFRNIDYANYMRIIKYYIAHTNEKNITSQNMLDISIILSDKNTYRVSLFDIDNNIDNFLQTFSNKKN